MTSNLPDNCSDYLDNGDTTATPTTASNNATKPRRKLRRSSDKPKSQWKPKIPRPKNMSRTEYYTFLSACRAKNSSDDASAAACASVWRTKKNPKLVANKSNYSVKERLHRRDNEGKNGNEDSEASSNK